MYKFNLYICIKSILYCVILFLYEIELKVSFIFITILSL